MIIKMGITIFP